MIGRKRRKVADMVIEIGKKKKVVIHCIKCGRPIMDTDDLKLRKKCPSCGTVNQIQVGPDMKVYQIREPKEVTEKLGGVS